MYKTLLMLGTLVLITACAGNSKDDELLAAAEESYSEASALVSEARSYGLKVTDAENKLAQASVFIKDEKYKDSIVSSEAAGKSASYAISKYKQKQDELAQTEEKERLAAQAKRQQASVKKHVVQAGDSLWNIARASSELDYDPLLWPIIFADNQSVIDDPDLISPDMVLDIRATNDADRLKKARSHAQRRGSWSLGSREYSDKSYLQQ